MKAQITKVQEKALINAISDASNYAALKGVATNNPDVFTDFKSYRSFETLFEYMQDCLEPVAKDKVEKPKKEKVPSAYGTAVSLMCKNPNLTFAELKEQLKKQGFEKDSACRTAHVTVKKVIALLKENKVTI